MSTYKDINELIKRLRSKIKYLLFQCTSDYPSKENIGLNVIGSLKKDLNVQQDYQIILVI